MADTTYRVAAKRIPVTSTRRSGATARAYSRNQRSLAFRERTAPNTTQGVGKVYTRPSVPSLVDSVAAERGQSQNYSTEFGPFGEVRGFYVPSGPSHNAAKFGPFGPFGVWSRPPIDRTDTFIDVGKAGSKRINERVDRQRQLDDGIRDYLERVDRRRAAIPRDQYDDIMDGKLREIAEWIQMRDDAIARGESEAAAQYNSIIGSLQKEVASAKQAQVESNAAYARYSSTVAPHFEEGIDAAGDIDNSALLTTAAEFGGQVEATYDSGVAELDAVLAKIDPHGDGDLARQMETQMRDFEGMMTEELQTDMSGLYRVAEAGKEFARAQAELAQQVDETMTDAERQALEASINAKIGRLQDQIAEAQKAKSDAIRKAREDVYAAMGNVPWFDSADDAFGYALDTWADGLGLNFEDKAEIAQFVDTMRNEGIKSRSEAEQWARDRVQDFSLGTLIEEFNLDVDAWELDEKWRGMLRWAADPKGGLRHHFSAEQARELEALGLKEAMEDKDRWEDIGAYKNLLDGYDLYRQHVDSWDDKYSRARGVEYGNAIADGYGYQGGSGTTKGATYAPHSPELSKLLYDAALYAFQGDERRAREWAYSDGLHNIIRRESNGQVGIVNYLGWKETGLKSKYDTAGFIEYAERSSHGDWSGWSGTVDRSGRSRNHSAAGLGQLNSTWYRKYVPEFGGARSLGNPFAEAVAMIRYVDNKFSSPTSAWRTYQVSGY